MNDHPENDQTANMVLPAHPGSAVLEPCWNETHTKIVGCTYDPVLAWGVRAHFCAEHDREDYFVTPITLEHGDSGGNWIIRRPDGSLMVPQMRGFKDEQDALAWMQQEHDQYEAAHSGQATKNGRWGSLHAIAERKRPPSE